MTEHPRLAVQQLYPGCAVEQATELRVDGGAIRGVTLDTEYVLVLELWT